jgi:hypothetical protein
MRWLGRFAFAACCLPLCGQSTDAGLVGIIRDATGAGVPAASIKVRNVDTNSLREAFSDNQGGFAVPNLRPGRYEIAVQKAGFQQLRETDLELQVNQTARLELRLQLGSLSESVEVRAQAPLLNTENAAQGDVIVAQEIQEMPLDGRNFSDLAFLVPGVQRNAQGDNASPFAIAGARSDNTNFYVDGFNNRDPRFGGAQANPSLEGMQEFKVETAGYSAEFGRLAGGVMTVVLKSGANRFHGSFFEYVRNDLFDARNYFAREKNELRRNQFGGSLNGPVRIPKLFDGRDRTFFLFTWESFREAAGSIMLSRVPMELERQGDFSQTRDAAGRLVQLKDPLLTGACSAQSQAACFPGNRIPLARMSPIALKLIHYWPAPNQPLLANNYQASVTAQNPWDSFLWKIDHWISSKDSFSFRYQRRRDSGAVPYDGSPLGTFGTSRISGQDLPGLSHTHLFSPALINEFRFGVSRSSTHQQNFDAGQDLPAALGISGISTSAYLAGLPVFNVTGYALIGDKTDRPWDQTVNLYQWSDTVTWVRSGHQLKFGGEILRGQVFQPYYTNNRGSFNFQGNWTSQSFADFLLGYLESASQQTVPPQNYLFSTNIGVFAQDDYKVTPRLTLNLGVRYELPGSQHDKYGRYSNFVPELGKIIVADDRAVPNFASLIVRAGLTNVVGVARDFGIPAELTFAPKKSVAPRFGFAWRPFGGNQTVVRGGYGIFYASSANNPVTLSLSNVFPWAITQNVNRVTTDVTALSLADPFRTTSGNTLSVGGYQLHPPAQYLQSWNLTLERTLGSLTALQVVYQGAKGTHLGNSSDVNRPYYTPELRQPNGSFPRPFPQINNAITYYSFGGGSSGQITYSRSRLTMRRPLPAADKEDRARFRIPGI